MESIWWKPLGTCFPSVESWIPTATAPPARSCGETHALLLSILEEADCVPPGVLKDFCLRSPEGKNLERRCAIDHGAVGQRRKALANVCSNFLASPRALLVEKMKEEEVTDSACRLVRVRRLKDCGKKHSTFFGFSVVLYMEKSNEKEAAFGGIDEQYSCGLPLAALSYCIVLDDPWSFS